MMSEDTDPTEITKPPDGTDSQLVFICTMINETEVLLERLRTLQIPQHIGMAAAGRALSVDVPKALIAQVQADLSSGALAQRFAEALKRLNADAGDDTEQRMAAIASLLIDLAQRAARYMAVRGEEWSSDAYRLEGQCGALEAQLQRFHRARQGIQQARAEGAAAEKRQAERRAERARGHGPRHGGDDGNS
jgi:hypothetical protein